MSKIFGAEHFISDFVETYDIECQRIVIDAITKTIKCKMPEVKIDEQKLKDWIVLCARLENIDKSDLVDIAVKKKFADKNEELAIYKRALEFACDSIRDMYCSDYCVCTRDESCKVKCPYQIYYNKEQFLNQAKKELEEQDVKD